MNNLDIIGYWTAGIVGMNELYVRLEPRYKIDSQIAIETERLRRATKELAEGRASAFWKTEAKEAALNLTHARRERRRARFWFYWKLKRRREEAQEVDQMIRDVIARDAMDRLKELEEQRDELEARLEASSDNGSWPRMLDKEEILAKTRGA